MNYNTSGNGYSPVRWTQLNQFAGVSKAAQLVRRLISDYASDKLGSTVLITGERGTGKAVVSSILHSLSVTVKNKVAYVCQNCGSIHGGTAESELFGHRKGAYTSADSRRQGCFMMAQGGTLFLDEIGNMSLELQAKLLHALEYRVIKPLGSDNFTMFDARLHLATNSDLKEMCGSGLFRSDLFDRINMMHIHIPPLRQRRDDIPVLAHALAKSYALLYGISGEIKFDRALIALLCNHDFPGNVRELEMMMRRAVFSLSKSPKNRPLCCDDISIHVQPDTPGNTSAMETPPNFQYPEKQMKDLLAAYFKSCKTEGSLSKYAGMKALFRLPQFEKEVMKLALAAANGNKALAARMLGIADDRFRNWKVE